VACWRMCWPALRAVHEQGYLHRDIKPANLYVRSRDRRVMLIDLARPGRRSAATVRRDQPGDAGLFAPEQYTSRNDRYGTWTDLYALGAVLYRCGDGSHPAEAASGCWMTICIGGRERAPVATAPICCK